MTVEAIPGSSERQVHAADLIRKTYEILRQLREPTPEDRKALGARGLVFFPIESKSYAEVVEEHPDHFWLEEPELVYATERRPVLVNCTIPVASEVGLNPSELSAPDSFDLSQAMQLEMAETLSQELQKEFPDARVIMLPVSAYAQADFAHKENTGEVLFKDLFARGLDMLDGQYSARAGRHGASSRFAVCGWPAESGSSSLVLVPAVVFVSP